MRMFLKGWALVSAVTLVVVGVQRPVGVTRLNGYPPIADGPPNEGQAVSPGWFHPPKPVGLPIGAKGTGIIAVPGLQATSPVALKLNPRKSPKGPFRIGWLIFATFQLA